jgi:hypothetical protein
MPWWRGAEARCAIVHMRAAQSSNAAQQTLRATED